MASKTGRGMSAATKAAAEPVAKAQAEGSRMVNAATTTLGTNQKATQFAESPLPVIPSGIAHPSPILESGTLPENFREIQKYLNILYPFTTPDPEDAYWQRRSQVVNASGDVEGVGKAIVPPEYFDYAQRKLNQTVSDQFKNFVFQQIDLSTPAAREYWESHFPEYTREFREGWKKRLGHMAKMGDMIINGVQSTEDLFYLFITEKGLNPVAFQYTGPPNQSQVAAMFNMYQQTFFPEGAGVSYITGARSGPPPVAGAQPGFGINAPLQNQFTGQILGTKNRNQVYGQRPGSQY